MEYIKNYLFSLQGVFARFSKKEQWLFCVCVVCISLSLLLLGPWSAPSAAPIGITMRIEKGFTVTKSATLLEEEGIIRSSFWFKVFSILFGGRGVIAGDYYFSKPQTVIDVTSRIARGAYGLSPIRITIPEGLNSFEVAALLNSKFSLLNTREFVAEAPEGYLFPDTYFFLPNISAHDAIELMRNNFNKKIEPLSADIIVSGKKIEDIVTMASIIEEETKTAEARRIVSGVLWKRISLGMPLQVDATFRYINGKHTYTLTKEDLQTDSPYNTYTNKGLPPTPIANPGLDSLKAALHPASTDYLYFLSDLKGNMYYAKDFEGHQRNRELYLRK